MAERNKRTDAVILTVGAQGEANRMVCALSPDRGVVYATLYGGSRSRLRSLVQPFNRGTLFLYEDPAKGACKVSDFDVARYHPALRESLYKLWAANMAVELILKTRCGGDAAAAYTLLAALLDGMDVCPEPGARLGMVRFLWRYLGVLGVRPDVCECAACGAPLRGDAGAAYVPVQSGLVCGECLPTFTADGGGAIPVGGEARAYLDAVRTAPPSRVRSLVIRAQSAYEMKRLVYFLIGREVGGRLKTMESGAGIL